MSEAEAGFLTDLQIFNLGGWQQIVAFNVLGGEAPGLKIWRWQDGMMELILEAAGLAQAPFITQDAPNRISVHRLERTSPQGICQDTITLYDWDGEQFNQVMQSVNDAVGCGNSSQ